ncbi:hypothetical protein NE237_003255 [Protea cynaroides]|uniref:Uncharacterized protein n=1 Tax=Protea cynaroides TaxID=273540 RepID=A0A9Q0KH19_9MAGN|nr:hypothetical protein NE237_003255 [Protea cynaroides]
MQGKDKDPEIEYLILCSIDVGSLSLSWHWASELQTLNQIKSSIICIIHQTRSKYHLHQVPSFGGRCISSISVVTIRTCEDEEQPSTASASLVKVLEQSSSSSVTLMVLRYYL